jgi:hypothetical protein
LGDLLDEVNGSVTVTDNSLKDESLALDQLDGVRGTGENTEHSLGLKPDESLFLKVERPLEAAEVEVGA